MFQIHPPPACYFLRLSVKQRKIQYIKDLNMKVKTTDGQRKNKMIKSILFILPKLFQV